MIGNCKKNKWCCFCKHWYDPACQSLKKLPGRDLFEIVQSERNRCCKCNLETPAVHTCPKFEPKF